MLLHEWVRLVTGAAIGVMMLALPATGLAQSGVIPLVSFTKGQFQFQQDGKAHTIPLQTGTFTPSHIGLAYEVPTAQILAMKTLYWSSEVGVESIRGPGVYRGNQIQSLILVATGMMVSNLWRDCAVTLHRFAPAGVEGSVACAQMPGAVIAKGQKPTPLKNVRFTASP